MIIVRINGGLGNQLFQYAAARALALRNASELVIDARSFRADRQRRYCLHHFEIQGMVCQEGQIAGCRLPPPRNRLWSYLHWRCTDGRELRYVRERSFVFDQSVLKLGPRTYLEGYWQSERYFLDAAEALRRELAVSTPASQLNRTWLEKIAAGSSVSVHVRRGDYVSNATIGRIHGTCDLQYYQQAAELICRRLGEEPTFYVFSDEPQWAEANIRLPGLNRFINHNDDGHNYEDLRLMAACQHHIIANSSFSWWAAWLAANPDKLVIAPRRWFRDASKDDRDLIPPSWLRI